MPTTLPIRQRRLALDRRDQIADVGALQQLLAERVQRGAPLRGGCAFLPIPLLAQLLDAPLVFLALALDWRPGGGKSRGKRRGVAASLTLFANLVELLVQRKHLFE